MALFGWKITGELPKLRQFVVVVAPHTTAWDLAVGMLAIYALGIQVSWMGADWIFRLLPFLRALGGVPIDRSKKHGVVGQTLECFVEREKFVVVVTPEGSRSKRPWKSGFYHMAQGAGVPILLVGANYRDKQIELGPVVSSEGSVEDVMDRMRPFFERFEEIEPDRFEFRLRPTKS